jgi:predicted unusual protein kinase regulating ubiquinone biosynthesis (AarF/ABC1/UbiB family)
MPAETVHEVLADQLGPDWRERFAEFNDDPAAAASIGQVHRAVYRDGRVVAVKIQRPGRHRELEDDEWLINAFLWPYKIINPKLYEDFRASLRDLVDTVRAELDFVQEAAYMTRFREFFEGRNVVIPEVVSATPRVIVMDYIPSEGPPTQSGPLLELFFAMVFDLGLVHTDLHAGNLGMRGASLVVYDFGSVLECPESLRTCLKQLMVSYLNRNTSVMLEYLLEYKVLVGNDVLKEDERRMLESFLDSVMAYVERTDMKEFARVIKTIALPAETTVSFRADVLMVFRSFTLLEGLCKELDPDFVILDAVAPLTQMFVTDPMMYRLTVEDDLRTIDAWFRK